MPLTIHVDGVETYTNTEHIVFSVSSVLSRACDVLDMKFLVLKVPASMVPTEALRIDMYKTAACYFAWCFEVLQTGRWPPTGLYGETVQWPGAKSGDLLMGGYSGAMAFMKTDGKARIEAHQFPFNYRRIFMCDECFAVQPFPSVLLSQLLSFLLYTDFSRVAGWRKTTFCHDFYLRHCSNITPWMAVPGFRKELVAWCFMHLGPLGFLRDFSAAMVIDFLRRCALMVRYGCADVDGILRHLWLEFKQWSKDRGYGYVSSAGLTLTKLGVDGLYHNNKYPELASSIKASTVKTFTCFLAWLAVEIEQDDPRDNLRAAAGWGIAEFIWICDTSGVILSESQVRRLQDGGRTFLEAYAELARRAAVQKSMMWKVRPKLHEFEHLLSFVAASRINPLYMSAWHEESFLGKVKKLTIKCQGGPF